MQSQDIFILSAYTAAILAAFGAGEVISRRYASVIGSSTGRMLKLDAMEWSRKLVHMFCGCLLATLPFVGASSVVGVAIGVQFLILLSVLQYIRARVGLLNFLFERRQGAVIFALGLVLMSTILFEHKIAFTA